MQIRMVKLRYMEILYLETVSQGRSGQVDREVADGVRSSDAPRDARKALVLH